MKKLIQALLFLPFPLYAQTSTIHDTNTIIETPNNIPAVLMHGPTAIDAYAHNQIKDHIWNRYQIIPHIIGNGAYGDDAGTSPGDPIPLIINTNDALNYAPKTFTGRSDLPISDEALKKLALERNAELLQNGSEDPGEKFYVK